MSNNEEKTLYDRLVAQLESKVHSSLVRAIYKEKLNQMIEGTIELNMPDLSTIWSDLFTERNVVFLRATSMIAPLMWKSAWVSRYDSQIRDIAEYLTDLAQVHRKEYEALKNIVRNAFIERLSKNLHPILPSILTTDFERIFILKEEQLQNFDTFRMLCELISSQSEYMTVKFLHARDFQTEDLRDFAIAVSKEGDLWVYKTLFIGETAVGGTFTYNPVRVEETIRRYRRLSAGATFVSSNSTVSEVMDKVIEVAKRSKIKVETQMIDAERTKQRFNMKRKRLASLLIGTGHRELDDLLFGGIPRGHSVLLTSSPCDERDSILESFLKMGLERNLDTFLVTTKTDQIIKKAIEHPNFRVFICNLRTSEEVRNLPNTCVYSGVEALTNLTVDLVSSVKATEISSNNPKRACIEILADVLSHFKVVETKKWLNALFPELKRRHITTIAVLDPGEHPPMDTRAVSNIFDGEIEIYEKETKMGMQKYLRVRRMPNHDFSRSSIPI